ncbi:MAG: hypothetical protein GEU90_03710 [Gemmatimonas sp.]|nr:hypothetical protein [Gemmatimonas sp.]
MRILAFLTDPFTTTSILRHLNLPHTPPSENPALDVDPFLDLDQTPTFDPTEPDPIPEFDFDQTHRA